MNYLILGASGFLGKNLTLRLLQNENNYIRTFSRDLSFYDLNSEQIEKINGDFRNYQYFENLTKNIDIVYHLISTSIPNSKLSLTKDLEDNVNSTIKLLSSCVKNGVKKIIFISSGGTVYGSSSGVPFRETDQTNPINSYGIQKLLIEKYLHLYYYQNNLDYRIIRLSNPYGRFQNPQGSVGLVTKFVYNNINNLPITIYGDGNIIRDYIDIDDTIQGFIDIENSELDSKLYNLGSGIGHSINDVVNLIEETTDNRFKKIYIAKRSGDTDYNVLDISRYNQISSLHYPQSIESGIKKLIKEFQND